MSMSANVALELSAKVTVNEGILSPMQLDFKKESLHLMDSIYL